MKKLKYITLILGMAAMFTACDGSRKNATLGNTSDTSTVAGVKDTSGNVSADSTKKDSSSAGNVDPTGHPKQ